MKLHFIHGFDFNEMTRSGSKDNAKAPLALTASRPAFHTTFKTNFATSSTVATDNNEKLVQRRLSSRQNNIGLNPQREKN